MWKYSIFQLKLVIEQILIAQRNSHREMETCTFMLVPCRLNATMPFWVLLNKACLPLCNQGTVFLGGCPCLTVEQMEYCNCGNSAQEELHYWRKEDLKQTDGQLLDGEHVEHVEVCTFVEMCLCNYEIRMVSLNLDSYGYFLLLTQSIYLHKSQKSIHELKGNHEQKVCMWLPALVIWFSLQKWQRQYCQSEMLACFWLGVFACVGLVHLQDNLNWYSWIVTTVCMFMVMMKNISYWTSECALLAYTHQ